MAMRLQYKGTRREIKIGHYIDRIDGVPMVIEINYSRQDIIVFYTKSVERRTIKPGMIGAEFVNEETS